MSFLSNKEKNRKRETKYLGVFNEFDVTNLYFSYEFDLTQTVSDLVVQMMVNNKVKFKIFLKFKVKLNTKDRDSMFKNPKANNNYGVYNSTGIDEPFNLPVRSRYCWNTHLLQPLLKFVIGQEFILPAICGFFRNEKIKISDRIIKIGILSRRSRFYVGPRFLKRGIDEAGDVANEVETDLFCYEVERFSSKLSQFTNYQFVKKNIIIFKLVSWLPPIFLGTHQY